MRQTCFSADGTATASGVYSGQAEKAIQKLHEVKHPYYYIEYFPSGSDHLQQICSLVRITSFINACHRVKQFQQLS
jgi:hypothetical protein